MAKVAQFGQVGQAALFYSGTYTTGHPGPFTLAMQGVRSTHIPCLHPPLLQSGSPALPAVDGISKRLRPLRASLCRLPSAACACGVQGS